MIKKITVIKGNNFTMNLSICHHCRLLLPAHRCHDGLYLEPCAKISLFFHKLLLSEYYITPTEEKLG
ncbi:rCG25702, isoform CRA_a [Rattus norvegicus]|uniref:RCG25702, isoform CRA_a n=1 Tax=Rattus norvegicus TaxID=10116 RepID=A6I1P4_RAT|nr:rCG25702, isoform CRA_a [Rattus norvegicus]